MSANFYSQVSRFYTLLDVDQDGRVDREEARLGFTCCFSSVHRESESLESKEAAIQQQVDFLFQAAAAGNDSSSSSSSSASAESMTSDLDSIDEATFKSCYQRLLAAAYEEEVLSIDLQRAISSLESSPEWTSMRAVFNEVSQLYTKFGAELLPTTNATHKAVLEALFTPVLKTLGPRSGTAAKKLTTPLLESASGVSKPQLVKCIKQLLAVPVAPDALEKAAKSAVQLANGGAASSSSSSAAK